MTLLKKMYILEEIKIKGITMKNTLKADFSIIVNNPNYLLIRDNSDKTQTMSVTNDAENVVKFLSDKGFLFKNTILYYIDTMGRVDILEHDGKGNFIGFKSGYANKNEFYNKVVKNRH